MFSKGLIRLDFNSKPSAAREMAQDLSGLVFHSHGAHGHTHDPSSDALDGTGKDLFSYIDRDKILCLNEARSGMAKGIIRPWSDRLEHEPHLESEEGDAELLITIPFMSAVNVRSFTIAAYKENRAPNKIKLFVNRNDLDFDLARDMEPTQEYELTEDYFAAVDYPLLPKKFIGVTSLTLFIPSNFLGEEEATMMGYLGFKGLGTEAKRGVVEAIYESSAQLKDHKVQGDTTAKSYLT